MVISEQTCLGSNFELCKKSRFHAYDVVNSY